MSNKIFFHELKFLNCHGMQVIELFVGKTANVLKDPIISYRLTSDSNDSPATLETLHVVKTIRNIDLTKYSRINIIN